MQVLQDHNFEASIRQGLWVVDFWSPTCQPCKIVTPILEDLAREFGDKANFASVNAREELRTALSNRIAAYPTVVAYRDGEPLTVIYGAQPARVYRERLGSLLTH